MAQAAEKRVLVFAEYGTDYRVLCTRLRETFTRAGAPVAVVPVTAAQMRQPGMMDNDKTVGFFLPGASHADYDSKMGTDNIKCLRRFVANGGRFMGICAGAYYACETIEWFKDDPARYKTKKPRIDFFNYLAHGPIRELLDGQTDLSHSLSHVAAARITVNIGDLSFRAPIMYWGGPQLSGHSEGDVIARFDDVAGQPPAIVMREYGRGRALISSVHPEIRGADFRDEVQNDPHNALCVRSRAAGEDVAQYESTRDMLWRHMMHRLFPEYIRG